MTDLVTRMAPMSDDDQRKKGVEAEREPNFLFAPVERRFLPWAAGRLPRWILPDDMTALGVAAALGVCAGVPALQRRKGLALGRERALGPAVGGGQPGRHARPGARHPAAEVRLLPGPHGRRDRDRRDRAGPRPLAIHAALDRRADRGRLS